MLRIYQQVGVAWLWHIHNNNLGGLLADEMGLLVWSEIPIYWLVDFGNARTLKLARDMRPAQSVVINVSGRGDKDVNEAIRLLEARGDRV